MIEMPMLSQTYGLDETLRRFRDEMETRFNGRSHWGQLLETSPDKVANAYPMLPTVKQSYKKMNVSGAFASEMTRRCGFDS